ncbi:aspartate/glutamate racemase family protein [Roseovarius atlanticus]|uniref:aspartate/glutamate racemase family protein n=1 Tax=Roseovarius atlanticus TaxID=1641875 RepID=UPI001C94E6A6|nr:aspartate/glutamate racemase family protein [Roseovarius atlanticus]MBY5989095.1 aspartate/glutamate racemase family protein [Roseovarius atlanticus]MBY6124487.1 aspartate/glutamate racemase family protein [Roseovarius atlanticus]MBY6148982.1 aspartate/glutamate racemase family protein [Roseovarius atlanticus]
MTTPDTPRRRIALIHALEESVAPIRAAFQSHWPEAYAFDLLDTSLAVDRAHAGSLDAAMMKRFASLTEYAMSADGLAGRAEGILFTCSAFGPAIDAVKARFHIPILRPNEAAFEQAIKLGRSIGLAVTFGPSEASLRTELEHMAAARGHKIEVRSVFVEDALDALKSGDGYGHDVRVAEAVRQFDDVDVVVLGQFSMARAAEKARDVVSAPVLTTPEASVRAIRSRLTQGAAPQIHSPR